MILWTLLLAVMLRRVPPTVSHAVRESWRRKSEAMVGRTIGELAVSVDGLRP